MAIRQWLQAVVSSPLPRFVCALVSCVAENPAASIPRVLGLAIAPLAVLVEVVEIAMAVGVALALAWPAEAWAVHKVGLLSLSAFHGVR